MASERLVYYFTGIAFLGSYLVYLNFRIPMFGYLITISSLFAALYFLGRVAITTKSITLSLILFVVTVISCFNADSVNVTTFVQLLFYPLVIFLIFNLQYNIAVKHSKNAYFIGDFILLFLLFNTLLAWINSLIGPLSLPILGTLELGRKMFFLPFRTSAGLLFGINYFAVASVLLSLVAIYFYRLSAINIDLKRKLLLIICFGSIILASSRSITALGLFVLSLSLLESRFSSRNIITISLVLIFFVSFFGGLLIAFIQTNDELSHSLRIYKGLNNRDDIWDAVTIIIKQNPILGAGSISSFESKLIEYGAPTTAVQNMYLLSLLKNGLLGFLFLFITLIISVYKAFTNNTKYLSLYLIIVIVTIDGFFRSYSIGGLGTSSFVLTFAIAGLLNEASSEVR